MAEVIVIAIVALLFLGPEKLPDAAKTISKGIRDFRKQTRELQQIVEDDNEIGGAIRDLKSALRGEDLAAHERRERAAAAARLAADNAAKAAEELAAKDGPKTLRATADAGAEGDGESAAASAEPPAGSERDDGPDETVGGLMEAAERARAQEASTDATASTPGESSAAAVEAPPEAAAAASDDVASLLRPARGAVSFSPVPLFANAEAASASDTSDEGDPDPADDNDDDGDEMHVGEA